MENVKHELTEYIEQRVGHYVHDLNTFLWTRTSKVEEFTELSDEQHGWDRIGGGNLLGAAGLFSALNYMSQIYWLLTREVYSDSDELGATKFLDNLDLTGEQRKKIEKMFPCPRKKVGSFDQTQAFIHLMSDCKKVHNFGVADEKELARIYKEIRHPLVHMLAPFRGNSLAARFVSTSAGIDYISSKKSIDTDNKPVIYHPKPEETYCHVDRLNRDVAKIANWLIEKIRSDSFNADKVDYTLHWIQEQLGDPTLNVIGDSVPITTPSLAPDDSEPVA